MRLLDKQGRRVNRSMHVARQRSSMTGVPESTSTRGAKIELRNLSKRFAGLAAVDDISLDIPAGAFVSLLGPSGSGKTTTLNLIAGFLTADTGDILFNDRSVANVPPHHRNIGM